MSQDTHKKTTESAKALADYWTPERSAAAIPKEAIVTGDLLGSLQALDEERRTGGSEEGQAPFSAESPLLVQAIPAAKKVSDPTKYPWCTVGKLYFEWEGDNYTGSAAVIKEVGLITAAHNLWDHKDPNDPGKGGSWSTKIRFVPADTDGAQPFGEWAEDEAWVKNQWIDDRNWAYDLGLVKLKKGGKKKEEVGKSVGWLGHRWDQTNIGKSWTDTGYPKNYQDTRFMYQQDGAFTRTLDSGGIVGKQGDLAGGTSGGPWLETANSKWYTNGSHSFRRPGQFPNEVFSPYFAQWVHDWIVLRLG